MTNIDRAAGIIRAMVKIENPTHDTDVAQALADNGLLTPAPQIVRTVEELEALDPETVIQSPRDDLGMWPRAISAKSLQWAMRAWNWNPFPAAVLVPADQVRAARKALEEA